MPSKRRLVLGVKALFDESEAYDNLGKIYRTVALNASGSRVNY